MNLTDYTPSILNRFLEYVRINTEADPVSNTVPSSMHQKDLSKLLFKECMDMGLSDVEMTDEGYVYARVPGNTDKEVPVICFCSHVDTAPDCSGKNVKPIVHKNYDGLDIVLPDDQEQILTTNQHPILKNHIGEDIITASGLTLLGADDKSGVAIIMETAQYLLDHPEVKHGDVQILFTTDEEIGKGVDHVNMDRLNADFGYTLDGGQTGSFENETFSANALTLTIQGVSAHPGYAKGNMENSMKILSEILARLPKDRLSPESTSGRDGFLHPMSIQGDLEESKAQFIVRDFDTSLLSKHQEELESIVQEVISDYPSSSYGIEIVEQYRNMREVLDLHPEVTSHAHKAIKRAGMEVIQQPIRGGTDGSRLSFMGLPCANIFTGMHGIHSKLEWISLQDMLRSMTTLIHLVQIWEEEA